MPTSPIAPILQAQRLVGRDAEVTHVRYALDAVRKGLGQTLLVSGEAGIGKTRLVNEALQQLVSPGFVVRRGCCYEQDCELPFAPLIEVFRASNIVQSHDQLGHSPLARLFPELGNAPIPSEPELDRRKLYEALVMALLPAHANSDEQGTVIIIEDLHWADEASLAFFLYWARRIGRQPVLLLMTYRGDEVNPSLERFLAALDRERLVSEIALKRLTETETAALIRAIFNLPRPPQQEFLSAIHQLTDGNPFFVEEVLKSFVAAGEIFELGGQWGRKPLGQLRVPRTVQAAVRQRTEQLNAEAQRLLSIAAVVGQRWNYEVLQRLTGHDDATLTIHIKAMLAAQLVVEESADVFAFRHALTRQAIYSSLLLRERNVLHGEIAEALVQLYRQQLETRLEELSYHFYAAGMWNKTLVYAQQAAERAQQLGAPRAAVEQWTRALHAAGHINPTIVSEIKHARGQAYEILGAFDKARTDFEQALDEARAAHNTRMMWRCLLDLGFLYTSRDFAVSHRYFDEALAVARILHDPVVLAHTLNRVGNWHVNCEQPNEGERLHHEALTLFESMDDVAGVAATLDLLAGALFLGGNVTAGMAHYTRAAEQFRILNDRRGLSSALVWLTHSGTVLNSMLAVASGVDCANAGQEALDLAHQIDWRAGESFAMVVLGMCLARQGEYDRALTLLQDGIDIAQDIDHMQGQIVGLFGLGVTYLDLLALDKAQETLDRGLALTQSVNILFGDRLYSALLSLTYVAHGELGFAKARSILHQFIGDKPSAMPSQPTLAQRLCWLAQGQLALAEGNANDAYVIAEQLIATAQQNAPTGVLAESRPLKLRGEALALMRREAEAEESLREALRSAERQGARPMQWRIQASLGRLLQTQSRRTESDTLFAAARTTVAALANAIDEEMLREGFLHNALNSMPTERGLTVLQATKQEFDGLTEREREVAVLVAQGHSNREIADTLSISQRTAGAHVGNILSKLGFSSRAQIAAWVTKRGLKA